MNAIKILILALLSLCLSLPAWAEKYGDAEIKKGKVIVLRAGGRKVHREVGKSIPIEHGDVIRVGRRSTVVISTKEKAVVTLGSNAVFQVKPWQKRDKKGLFRMLFGRMRAKIAKLTGGERFNVSTATATIGVKGTEETIFSNVQGDVTVGVTENTVDVAGIVGDSVAVSEGNFTGIVGGSPPGGVAPLSGEVLNALGNLDAPDPTSSEGVEVPLGAALVAAGIVTQDQIDQSEQGASEGVQADGAAALPPQAADAASDILDTITGQAQDAATEVDAPNAPISVDFEK